MTPGRVTSLALVVLVTNVPIVEHPLRILAALCGMGLLAERGWAIWRRPGRAPA